ncbi:MAG: M48 family metalloprotease [Desulfobulbaceae bacterium]|nr:M48 family metalloprotease [Desulfobulbaceae bacterium]
MIFNNLLYFLVVIFVLSLDSAPETPRLAPAAGFFTTLSLYLFFYFLSGWVHRRARPGSAGYFSAEKNLSMAAVLLFVFLLHFVDLKYYLHPLSLDNRLPILENIGGLLFFYLFLVLMWLRARPYYLVIFQRLYSPLPFIVSNTRVNLPIILPWLLLSLVFDLLAWFEFPAVKRILDSPAGDLVLFAVFVFFLLLFFPPLVRWLWNCTPLPPSPLRQEIEAFFRKQKFSSEILLWPLFEGQVVTAAILGILPGMRYLLITPALLNTMNRDELEAVLAHEIGHVKKKHLLLYIFLFLGFSVLAGAVTEPLPFLYLGSDWFYALSNQLNQSPEPVLAVLTAVPVLVLMLMYFRFLFGYFIRNFERQADLHVFKAQGHCWALISAFEKIAMLAGNIREQKSWHHFGISERVEFLERCEQDRSLLRKHDRKVHASLALYFIVIAAATVFLGRVDYEQLAAGYEIRYMEAVITHKLHQEPENGLLFLLLGNIMQEKKMERRALQAYERALLLNPDHADIYNNLSWLLLTARDSTLLDPPRALALAEKALSLDEKGYILDTLAVALWANGQTEKALAAEKRAMRIDPENSGYYRQQAEKMAAQDWQASRS